MGRTLGRSMSRATVCFQVSKSSKKNIRGDTKAAEINDDQIRPFCASGIFFFHNKNMGEGLLSSCVFLRSSSKPCHRYTKADGYSESGERKARTVSAGLSGTSVS